MYKWRLLIGYWNPYKNNQIYIQLIQTRSLNVKSHCTISTTYWMQDKVRLGYVKARKQKI